MVRSVFAIAGAAVVIMLVVVMGTLLATVLLAGPAGSVTASYLAANLGTSLTAAFLGGWLVVRFAPRRPFVHAAVLASLLAALTLPGLRNPVGDQPLWYPLAILCTGLLGVAFGAAACSRRTGDRADQPHV